MAVPPPTHSIAPDGDPLQYIDQEWLLTNGTGAFAMGTVPGVNTRRYHALFIAAQRPPVARIAVLNQVLEQVVVGRVAGGTSGGTTLEFTSCEFRDAKGTGRVFSPQGAASLVRFERGTSITWVYRLRGPAGTTDFEVTRQLSLPWKQQAAVLHYSVRPIDAAGKKPPTQLTLRLAPMVTLRDFHAVLSHDAPGSPGSPSAPAIRQGLDAVTLQRPSPDGRAPAPAATLRCPGARFTAQPEWWFKVFYPIEEQRGQDALEDYFLPGWFELPLDAAKGGEAVLTVALGDQAAPPSNEDADPRHAHLAPIAERMSGIAKAAATQGKAPASPALPAVLALAADDFVVDRFLGDQRLATIIAGYPWFADWGRDTFIALPGLLLATGRFDEARSTLRAFAGSIRDGLVPNVFDDYNATAAHYNTVDASLWFVNAAMQYVHASGDRASWDQWLADACTGIIEAYIKGTSPADAPPPPGSPPLIRMAGDGLITAGSLGTQLTWMDAACDGQVFTPRCGKAVEINALWFHVLTGMADMLEATRGNTADHYRKLTARIGRAFSKLFWDDQAGYLYDHAWVDAEGQEHIDKTCRPNQILAVSLPHSPLPRKRQQQVLNMVQKRLLTPVGLRTLPTDDPHYHGRYEGSPHARDEAYHQGTAWAWLLGPYAEAILRVGRFSPASRTQAWAAIQGAVDQMLGPGLGQLHEIFDADAPHTPRGCTAQAWSVAEVIRVMALIGQG